MGNDGGSIPTRRELVREAARERNTTEARESHQEQLAYYWSTCPLSHTPLARPVVSDWLGKLYNKDAVLRFLLPAAAAVAATATTDTSAVAATNGSSSGSGNKADNEAFLAGRIRSLKDIVEVKFEVEQDADTTSSTDHRVAATAAATRGSAGARRRKERWVCPVTRKELGPSVRSVYLSPCGHAFSEIAIREVAEEKCLQCNEPFTPENVIPILPTAAADIERLTARTLRLKEQGLTHSLKKAPGSGGKKRRKNDKDEAATATDAQGDGVGTEGDGRNRAMKQLDAASKAKPNSEKHASGGGSSSSSSSVPTSSSIIRDAATASLTARVIKDEMERSKRRKLGMNDNLKTLFTSSSATPASAQQAADGAAGKKASRNSDFMTRGYTIPANARRI